MRVLLVAMLAVVGCTKPPQPERKPAETKPASADAETKAAEAPKPPPLSEEDKRLIALDPKELTPELRRKRAYALRRKAMQDPNSPLARTLTDLQKAAENGDLQPPGKRQMPTFTVDGKPPAGGAGPAGTRPGPAGSRDPAE
jgi:hypothetical protein